MKQLSPSTIFLIGFVLGGIGSFAIAFLATSPFLFLFGVSSSSGIGLLAVSIGVGIFGGTVLGIFALILVQLWSGFGKREQFAIAALILLVGVATFQPEIDLVGLLAILLAAVGRSKKP